MWMPGEGDVGRCAAQKEFQQQHDERANWAADSSGPAVMRRHERQALKMASSVICVQMPAPLQMPGQIVSG